MLMVPTVYYSHCFTD